jgi:hypothetical protein
MNTNIHFLAYFHLIVMHTQGIIVTYNTIEKVPFFSPKRFQAAFLNAKSAYNSFFSGCQKDRYFRPAPQMPKREMTILRLRGEMQ